MVSTFEEMLVENDKAANASNMAANSPHDYACRVGNLLSRGRSPEEAVKTVVSGTFDCLGNLTRENWIAPRAYFMDDETPAPWADENGVLAIPAQWGDTPRNVCKAAIYVCTVRFLDEQYVKCRRTNVSSARLQRVCNIALSALMLKREINVNVGDLCANWEFTNSVYPGTLDSLEGEAEWALEIMHDVLHCVVCPINPTNRWHTARAKALTQQWLGLLRNDRLLLIDHVRQHEFARHGNQPDQLWAKLLHKPHVYDVQSHAKPFLELAVVEFLMAVGKLREWHSVAYLVPLGLKELYTDNLRTHPNYKEISPYAVWPMAHGMYNTEKLSQFQLIVIRGPLRSDLDMVFINRCSPKLGIVYIGEYAV
jgi:hypothetical protein